MALLTPAVRLLIHHARNRECSKNRNRWCATIVAGAHVPRRTRRNVAVQVSGAHLTKIPLLRLTALPDYVREVNRRLSFMTFFANHKPKSPSGLPPRLTTKA